MRRPTVAGRLVSVRDMGKTVFAHIEDGYGRIQLFLRRNEIGEESHRIFRKLLDLGDFVQASGNYSARAPVRSACAWRNGRCSKAVSPLPVVKEQEVDGEMVRYSAFSDVEERYRQRYADLAVNPEVRDLFRTRARVISRCAPFSTGMIFWKWRRRCCNRCMGGRRHGRLPPSTTSSSRNCSCASHFELYLKRLLVGGFERVYEIGRDFRNEGVSFKHNPEFTMLEFYAAYWDYDDVMDFTEKMMQYVAEVVHGSLTSNIRVKRLISPAIGRG
jgi:lysyl-tRNA synthetase class 2